MFVWKKVKIMQKFCINSHLKYSSCSFILIGEEKYLCEQILNNNKIVLKYFYIYNFRIVISLIRQASVIR